MQGETPCILYTRETINNKTRVQTECTVIVNALLLINEN